MKPSFLPSTLRLIFIAVSIGAFLFSAWVLWLTPLYGDDLWHISTLRAYSFWDILTKPVFGDSNHIPVFHLWMWLLSTLPIDIPWVHLIQSGLLIVTCGLFHLYLHQMAIPSWIRWMSTALFLTTPTIAQAIYWSSATHLWLGSIWILIALILLPRTPETSRFWRWVGCFLCLLFAMMTTEMTYGFCVLFLVCIAWKYRKNLKLLAGCAMTTLLMIAIVAQRNHLITGHWAQLSLQRELERPIVLKEVYISFYELLIYSHPLALLDKFSKGYFLHGKLSEGWLAFHFLWTALLWGIIFQRKGRNGWDLFLLTFATPLMIIVGNSLIFERYLIATIIGNVLALGIFVDCFRNILSGKLSKMMGILAIVVTLINMNIFVRQMVEHWVKNAVRHHTIVDLAKREQPDAQHPIGLVDSLSLNLQPPKDREWWSAPRNGLYERQLILSNLGSPHCIYDLLDKLPFEGHKSREGHISSINYLKQQCAWPPQQLRCFKYYQTGSLQGEFRSYRGQVKFSYLLEKHDLTPQELLVTCL